MTKSDLPPVTTNEVLSDDLSASSTALKVNHHDLQTSSFNSETHTPPDSEFIDVSESIDVDNSDEKTIQLQPYASVVAAELQVNTRVDVTVVVEEPVLAGGGGGGGGSYTTSFDRFLWRRKARYPDLVEKILFKHADFWKTISLLVTLMMLFFTLNHFGLIESKSVMRCSLMLFVTWLLSLIGKVFQNNIPVIAISSMLAGISLYVSQIHLIIFYDLQPKKMTLPKKLEFVAFAVYTICLCYFMYVVYTEGVGEQQDTGQTNADSETI